MHLSPSPQNVKVEIKNRIRPLTCLKSVKLFVLFVYYFLHASDFFKVLSIIGKLFDFMFQSESRRGG